MQEDCPGKGEWPRGDWAILTRRGCDAFFSSSAKETCRLRPVSCGRVKGGLTPSASHIIGTVGREPMTRAWSCYVLMALSVRFPLPNGSWVETGAGVF